MIVSSGMRVTPQRFSVPTGRVSVSGGPTDVLDTAISFGFTFAAPPRVGAIINGNATTNANVRVANVTTTGCTLRIYGVNGTTFTLAGALVDWWAIPA